MRVVFVTSEYAPIVPGGAGTVVASLEGTLTSAGHDVTIVLVTPHRTSGLPDNVVVAPPADGADPFTAAADAASAAVGELAAAGSLDLIEVQDFDALGFGLLTRRHALGIDDVTVAVRIHGPVDLMVDAMGVTTTELSAVAARERQVLALADAVLVPSAGLVPFLIERYALESDRVVLAPPPVDSPAPVHWRPSQNPEFVALGRLSEVKGSHDVVAASIDVCRRNPDVVVRLIGQDGWSATHNRSMAGWLTEMIPDALAERIRIEGRVEHSDLPEALASAWAVVTASRFESFCLAAHEARRMGLPVIVSDLPAFSGSFDEATGALVTTRQGLVPAIERLAQDTALRDRLAAAPVPVVGDPVAAYLHLPPPRHSRSQAALATMALDAVAVPAAEVSPLARVARSVLRMLPEPVARAAVKVLPQRLKDRFRSVASWPAEKQRRLATDRHRSLAARMDAGEFPVLDAPLVTVVIPVYNQGAYLADAVASVYEQTMDSFEIIVVDDGSTEASTVATIDALDLDRVRVIRQENRGLPAARNAGMAEARGRYVVPLDADDEITPRYLEMLTGVLEEDAGAAYAHCWAELYGDVEALWATRPFNKYMLLLANSVVGCVVLRREAWEKVGGYDETMTDGNEDWELWVRLMKAGWGQVQVPEPLFKYRKHGVSMSVETEARFVEGLDAIRRRHPDLYSIDALAALKSAEYPLVTVVGGPAGWITGQSLGDVQHVAWEGDLEEVGETFRRVGGKYVMMVSGDVVAAPTALETLAGVLEADSLLSCVKTPGGVALWRVLALRDGSWDTSRLVDVDVDAAADVVDLEPGMFADPLWTAPSSDRLTVQRQAPEESGYLPEWIRT